MRLKYTYISVFLFLFFLTTVLHAGPLVYFEEKSYDFGEVAQGDILEHEFKLKNSGTSTLVIKKIDSS